VQADRIMFESFRTQYGKNYVDEMEAEYRFAVFRDNLAKIRQHQAEFEAGLHTYTMAVNKFADMSNEEYRRSFLGYRKTLVENPFSRATIYSYEGATEDLPAAVDWREKNVVTPIKNQGQCGSCWSFSATGSMEGAHALQTGNLVSLSEQELVDCVLGGADNCQVGGEMQSGFEYAISNGMETESDYPYCACSGGGCKYNAGEAQVHITGYQNVTSGSEADLQAAVANQPTVSIAIDAGLDSFQFYSSGVYNAPLCGNKIDDLDHGVLIVGYGTTSSGVDYWIVKNSWGTDWGMAGYIWMSRNKNNQCGVATDACFPTV